MSSWTNIPNAGQGAWNGIMTGLANSVGGQVRSSRTLLTIGMHVLITDGRPYREGRIVALATKYDGDNPDYVKVSYLKGFFMRPREEWLSEMSVVPIGLVKQITDEEKA